MLTHGETIFFLYLHNGALLQWVSLYHKSLESSQEITSMLHGGSVMQKNMSGFCAHARMPGYETTRTSHTLLNLLKQRRLGFYADIQIIFEPSGSVLKKRLRDYFLKCGGSLERSLKSQDHWISFTGKTFEQAGSLHHFHFKGIWTGKLTASLSLERHLNRQAHCITFTWKTFEPASSLHLFHQKEVWIGRCTASPSQERSLSR